MQYISLASGSSGNVSYISCNAFGLLVDLGLGPRQLETRLKKAELSTGDIRAVLLTHTHTDHWKDRTFTWLQQQRIPLYCHPDHQRALAAMSKSFVDLNAANLVLAYEVGKPFRLTPHLSCLPFQVPHDSGVTCGFRIEGPTDLFGEPAALAYASDLGHWDAATVEMMSGVDLLAVEFNHDTDLQKNSRRSAQTIARNLGKHGHLSNAQAAKLVGEVLRRSPPGRLQHLVQLHLSRECNTPELAAEAVRGVLTESLAPVKIYAASQSEPGPVLSIGAAPASQGAGKKTRRSSASEVVGKEDYVNLPLRD